MGDRTTSTTRAVAAAAAALAATLLLASCSLPGGAPGASDPAGTTAVVDPSIPSPTASATPAATEEATPSPVPTATAVVATPTPAADARTAVTPFITSPSSGATVSGDLDVSAIVPKVVESGGTCTLVATKGSTRRTDESKAVAASSYTGCEPLTIADLPAGAWSITVRYTSDESAGTSAAVAVTAG